MSQTIPSLSSPKPKLILSTGSTRPRLHLRHAIGAVKARVARENCSNSRAQALESKRRLINRRRLRCTNANPDFHFVPTVSDYVSPLGKTTDLFCQVRSSTAWCWSDTPIDLRSAPETSWPQTLGHTPLPTSRLLELGSRSSERACFTSRCCKLGADWQCRVPPGIGPGSQANAKQSSETRAGFTNGQPGIIGEIRDCIVFSQLQGSP